VNGGMGQTVLESSALSDVLQLTDQIEGCTPGVTNAGNADQSPHIVALHVPVSLLDLVAIHRAGDARLELGETEVLIFVMGDVS
jgi:hypothetical protein